MFALCPAFFILYLESFISRLNVIPCHDLTLSVGEPENAAAQTGAGTSFGANGNLITRAESPLLIFCVLTIRKQLLNLSGRGPSICYRRPFCRLKAPLGLSLLRYASQTRSHPKPCSSFVPCGTNGTACRALHNFTEELSNRQEV